MMLTRPCAAIFFLGSKACAGHTPRMTSSHVGLRPRLCLESSRGGLSPDDCLSRKRQGRQTQAGARWQRAAVACAASSRAARRSRSGLLPGPSCAWAAFLRALDRLCAADGTGSWPATARGGGGTRRPPAPVGRGGFSEHAPSLVCPPPSRCRRRACSAGPSQEAAAATAPVAPRPPGGGVTSSPS